MQIRGLVSGVALSAIVVAWGCRDATAPNDTLATTERLTLLASTYGYRCGGWGSAGVPPVTRTVFDVQFAQAASDGSARPEDVGALVRAGGRVVRAFPVARARVALDVAAVPTLMQGGPAGWVLQSAVSVNDTLRAERLQVTVVMGRLLTDEDLRMVGAVGGTVTYAPPPDNPFRSAFAAEVPEAGVAILRAQPGVAAVAEQAGGCLLSTTGFPGV